MQQPGSDPFCKQGRFYGERAEGEDFMHLVPIDHLGDRSKNGTDDPPVDFGDPAQFGQVFFGFPQFMDQEVFVAPWTMQVPESSEHHVFRVVIVFFGFFSYNDVQCRISPFSIDLSFNR